MMVRLNLLPWRERQRLAAVRRFQRGLVVSLLFALCAVMVLDHMARQRGLQQASRIAERQAGLAQLDGQLESLAQLRQARERTLAQSAALAALRVDQGVLPRLFAELERALSAGLQLTDLSLQDGQLELTGLGASSAVVAQFMRELQQSRLLEGLELKQIKAHSQGDEFLLLARLPALSK